MKIIQNLFRMLLIAICGTFLYPLNGSESDDFVKYLKERNIPHDSLSYSDSERTCLYILKYSEIDRTDRTNRTLYAYFYCHMALDRIDSPLQVFFSESNYSESLDELMKRIQINNPYRLCRCIFLNNVYYLNSDMWDWWNLSTELCMPLDFNDEEKNVLKMSTWYRIQKCYKLNTELICSYIPIVD